MSLGIFKKAWNTTQLNDLLAVIGSTYLSIANATSTYLTKAVASSTYLTQADAATDYVAKDYKEYMAILTQTGSNPISTVEVVNDFTTPLSVYSSNGVYSLTFNNELGAGTGVVISLGSTLGSCGASYAGDNTTINIWSTNTSFSAADDILTNATIYLRYYP